MKISDYIATQPYQFNPKGPERVGISQRASTFTQDNTINFTTKEGDRVTLSQSFTSALSLMNRSENSANGTKHSMTATTLENESISLQVEGDLNEEELADIQKLLKNLYAIAEDFFSGEQGDVLAGINDLTKDMGSISNLSASFYQTQMYTSYTSVVTNSQQPLAGFQDAAPHLSSGLQSFEENDKSDVEFVNELLKGQWQQISKMLDLYNTELHEENAKPPVPTNTPAPLLVGPGISDQDKPEEDTENTHRDNHANQMIHRVADIMHQHPRLQPFSVPIVNTVIDKVAEANNANDSQLVATLKKDFTKQFNQWLTT